MTEVFEMTPDWPAVRARKKSCILESATEADKLEAECEITAEVETPPLQMLLGSSASMYCLEEKLYYIGAFEWFEWVANQPQACQFHQLFVRLCETCVFV